MAASAAELGPAEARVRYCVTSACDDAALAAAADLLSDDERSRRDAYMFERDRREYSAAHALLRTTLSTFGDLPPRAWRFRVGPHGKPALDPGVSASRLSFNLAHTPGLVACIVAKDADVGIDVERVTRPTDWRAVARRYFAVEEVTQIEAEADAGRAGRFFDFWTLKEAFLKAVGVGLSQPLNTIRFDLNGPGGHGAIGFVAPDGIWPPAWQFVRCQPTPEHRLAAAVSDGSSRTWRISVEAASLTGR